MGAFETRTFETAGGVAVRLPEALGIAPGTAVTIEQVGDMIEIRPVSETDETPATLGARLREIWQDAPPSETRFLRVPIDFPDRPGLY